MSTRSRSTQRSWIGLAMLMCSHVAWAAPEMSPDLIRRVELQWEEQEKATAYEMELGLNPEFKSTLYSEKIQGTKFGADLLPGAYYYRVRAVDKNGRPGKWTPIQELKINARPPKLESPVANQNFVGNLPDTGISLEWRSSGPSIKYLVEVKAQDASGKFGETVVKQEVPDTKFPVFPKLPGRYQWSVSTLGAGGDEPGETREFSIEGVYPRNVAIEPGQARVRIVRYVAPFWRGHWTLFARYGQAALGYSIVDQDFRASGSFTGITGYASLALQWEWHDPVCLSQEVIKKNADGTWLYNPPGSCLGIPWLEFEQELDRQTVLSESILLKRATFRFGTWFDDFKALKNWRFSPVVEFGTREYAFYQPLSSAAAVRSNTRRSALGFGVVAEKKLKSFLVVGGSLKILMESGGLAGIYPVGGVYSTSNRAGSLQSSTGFEAIGRASLQLGPRIKIEGRLRYEKASQTWTGFFPTASGDPLTRAAFSNFCFDVGVGLKF